MNLPMHPWKKNPAGAHDCVTACKSAALQLRNDTTSVTVTSAAVDEFQRPMIVVTCDVIHLAAVVARDHNLVAMTTHPRVV